jgi:hypothetical protein
LPKETADIIAKKYTRLRNQDLSQTVDPEDSRVAIALVEFTVFKKVDYLCFFFRLKIRIAI